jgi:hypothetical protein
MRRFISCSLKRDYFMDTIQARARMHELARETLGVLQGMRSGDCSAPEVRARTRTIAQEARTLLADAGYPGESTWRAVQRASDTLESLQPADSAFWDDLMLELHTAIETLDSLISLPAAREVDVHIIG